MVDQNDRTKKIGDAQNIDGWTGCCVRLLHTGIADLEGSPFPVEATSIRP
jgi:hypothetical protein